MRNLSSDFRLVVRSLRRSPLLTLVAVLSIGFAVGAITSVYSWLNAVVLHPFPAVRDPDSVVGLEVAGPDGDGWPVSFPTTREWRRGATTLRDVAVWTITRVSVRERGAQSSYPLLSMPVSGNYFGLLGARPAVGRVIEPDDESGIKPVAVLGHAYWLRQYGGDLRVIGRTIFANGTPLEIVGVAPARFTGTYVGVIPDLFVPITLHPGLTGSNVLEDRTARLFQALGRLKPGIAPAQAQREMDALARRLSAAAGDRPITGAIVKDIRTQYLGGLVLPLFVAMLAVSALLLAVACANVASLMVVRGTARGHEIAVRLALGASRRRVAAMSLIESGIIAALGGTLALVASLWARGLLVRIIPTESLPLSLPVSIDARVTLVSVAVAGLVAVASGLLPALRAMRTPAASALRAGARSVAGGASTARTATVAAQIALSLACLVLASLFIDGARAAARVDLGFKDPEHVLVVTTNLAAARLTDTSGEQAIDAIIARAASLPGVRSATVATYVPLGLGGRPVANLGIEGFDPMPNQNMSAMRIGVGPGYASLMRARVLAGRDIAATDRAGALPVVVVNETFARRFFPNGSAIGRRVDAGHGWCTIVGIVADGKYGSLTEHPQPVLYYPIAQWYQPGFNIYVRTAAGDPRTLAEPVRRMLQTVHVDIPALQPRTLAEHIAGATFVQRTGASVLAGFGAIALALSLIGLYGSLAIAIAMRRRELGIRLTLGASRQSIVWLVLRQGLLVAGVGVLAGIPLAIALGRVLRSHFDSVGALQPGGLAAAAAIVATAAAIAALTPARRALAVDPMEVLRADA